MLCFYWILRRFHVISKKKYQLEKDVSTLEKSDFFCKNWYIENYRDVNKDSPAKHYLTIGWKEGKNPSKFFNTNLYLKQNIDVAKSLMCPLLHWEKFGKFEGRKTYLDNEVINKSENNLKPVVKSIVSKTPVVKNTANPSVTAAVLQKKNFFSVIVASYNYEDYIKETLDSLINQNYFN